MCIRSKEYFMERRSERKRGGRSCQVLLISARKSCGGGSLDLKSLLRAECYKRKALCTRVSKYY